MSEIIFILVSFTLLILVIVGIHELGHFLAARWFNVQVIRFKIGFGKTLLKRFDKRGTEFSIGILPLGGYVQMQGEDHPLQGEEDLEDKIKGISYLETSLGARAIITSAGPIANFFLAVICYFLIFMIGVKDIIPLVGDVSEGSLAQQAGLSAGDKIMAIDNRKVLGLKDLNTILSSRIGDTGEVLIEFKKPNSNLKFLETVRIVNWLSSEIDQSPMAAFGIKPFIPPLIAYIQKDSPAERAGLIKGDVILSVGDKKVSTWYQLVEQISSMPDREAYLRIERKKELIEVFVSIGSTVDQQGISKGRLGIGMISSNSEMPEEFLLVTKKGPIKALLLGIKETYNFTILILDSIGKMITGSISSENIGGPIQIATISGAAAKAGLVSFISIMALLSINLGLVNLLPIPILDGGQLVLIAAEKIKGSELSEKFIEFAYKVGLLLVMGLMFFAVFNDITRMV